MPCFSCTLAELTKQYVIDTKTTPSPQIYQQSHPFDATDLTIPLLFLITLLTASFGEYIFEKKIKTLQLLCRSRILELKASSKWGVLLPNKKGKIPVVQENSVEVITVNLGIDKNLELNKEIWKINKIKLLRADNPLSEVQANIVTAVKQKLGLQAELEQLTVHAQKVKDMYELVKAFESEPKIIRKYEDIYLQDLAAISQANALQALQDENIKQLLLFVEIVKFDKENILVNSQERPETIADIKQNHLESVDRVKEYLKLSA